MERRLNPASRASGDTSSCHFTVLMIAIHLAMFAENVPLLGAVTIVGLVGLMWYSRREFGRELVRILPLKKTQTPQSSLLVKYTATSGVAALASIMSVLFIRKLIDPNG